jgi:hypothetical protein
LLKRQPFSLDATLVESEVHLLLMETTPDSAVKAVLNDAGLSAGVSIRDIEPSLEDVFVTITRRLASNGKR